MARLSRREALASGARLAAVAALAASELPAVAAGIFPREWQLMELLPETFEPHVGTTFIARGKGVEKVELRLARVRRNTASPGLLQFSILFEGAVGSLPTQAMYDLEHPVLGRVSNLFLVPVISPSPGIGCFEAVFARFHSPLGA